MVAPGLIDLHPHGQNPKVSVLVGGVAVVGAGRLVEAFRPGRALTGR